MEGEQIHNKPKLVYSDAEKLVLNRDIQIMCDLRETFMRKYPELDDMNRAQYYESNRKKDLSYIPAKKNKQETRIVTGTTREKDTTLLSTLLNLNAVPDVTAFDEEDMVVAELGDNMSDLIKKSREVEDWQKKRPIIYREMISQGDVFVEETYIEEFRDVPLERVEWNPLTDGVSELSFKHRLKKIHSGCSSRMVRGNMVYLGDMTIEYIEDQDIVAVCTIIPRGVAMSRYSQWERWKYVPEVIDTVDNLEHAAGLYSQNWSMFNTDKHSVSEVRLWVKSANHYAIYLNGIPMLPCNYPMTSLWPSGDLPWAQGKLEPISGFAISKSQPSKTKVDQEVIDELTTLMIDGIRQQRKPPMGYSGDKVFSPGIFLAGSMTQNVSKNTFHSILPPEALGLSNSEFSFYNLIKESINEKTTNEVYSGQGQGDVDTLGQAEIMQQQQLQKLGAAMDGVVNLERRLAWLRIDNVIFNWTAPLDSSLEEVQEGVLGRVNNYRKLSVDTSLEDGQSGIKAFRFQDQDFPEVEDVYQEEERLTKEQGKAVRIKYINPEVLRSKKYKWFIIVNPTPKSNDKLSQLLFVQNVRVALELFGPEALNLDYLKQRFAIMINEDYNKFFVQMNIMDMLQQGLAGTIGDTAEGSPPTPQRRTNTQPPKLAVA